MKTYIINQFRKVSSINKKLDVVSILKNNVWLVFDDNIDKTEKFVFMDKDKLLIAVNGVTSYSTWQYLAVSSSIIIDDKLNNYLLNVVACDENIVVLNLDGTQQYCFLLNTNGKVWAECDYTAIQWYLFRKCNIDILTDEQRFQYNKEKEQKRIEKQKQLRENEKLDREFYKIIICIIISFFIFAGILMVLFM